MGTEHLPLIALPGASSGPPFRGGKPREGRLQETVFNMNWLKAPVV